MSLVKIKVGQTATVQSVGGPDKIRHFLMTLGCNEGEEITVVSMLAGNYIINVKDCRYAIDKRMAEAIQVA